MRAPTIAVPIVLAGLTWLVSIYGADTIAVWLQGAVALVLAVWSAWQAQQGDTVHTMGRSALRADSFWRRLIRG